MAEYRERSRKSAAWEHFEVKDADEFTATCNLCHDIFSYRTSVSNLMKHLRTKHSFELTKSVDDDLTDAETDNEEKENPTDKRKTLKSEVWDHFEVKDPVERTATCNHCSEQFSYRTTSANLTRHLKRKHDVDLTKDGDGGDDDEEKVDTVSSQRRRFKSKSSTAWQYFEDTDPDRRVATCTICRALCSYRTSVSNLMKHARRKHGVGEQDVSDTDDQQPAPERANRSIVWLYFKCVDREARVARCKLCKKMISHASTVTNLKNHLTKMHPNITIPRKRILLSSGGELYEVETSSKQGSDDDDDDNDDEQIQNDTMDMDTVYLEDFDALEQDSPPKKRQKNLGTRTAYDTSSENEVTFDTPKKNDVLDNFGKYIASLLRQLPNQISNQLQSDFVKQIMNAQMKSAEKQDTQRNEYKVLDKSDEYSVTVTEDVIES